MGLNNSSTTEYCLTEPTASTMTILLFALGLLRIILKRFELGSNSWSDIFSILWAGKTSVFALFILVSKKSFKLVSFESIRLESCCFRLESNPIELGYIVSSCLHFALANLSQRNQLFAMSIELSRNFVPFFRPVTLSIRDLSLNSFR